MKRRYIVSVALGKMARSLTRLRGGGGSALPGLIVEKLSPSFLSDVLGTLPKGVVVVVGTNGKTTTTKIISDLLESQGLSVLTNNSGSNFVRGILATIVKDIDLKNFKLSKDIAVLEIDEAYAAKFVDLVKPDYVVALNILRDQLDRFGELSKTTRLLAKVLSAAKTGAVINGDEPKLVEIGHKLKVPVSYYGASSKLAELFPTDAELLVVDKSKLKQLAKPRLNVELLGFSAQQVSYRVMDQTYELKLTLSGHQNFHNVGAVIALTQVLLSSAKPQDWLKALEQIKPAFGRGELISVGDIEIELQLVKNPSSFRQVLAAKTDEAVTMIAINDNFADGRDVSWLWDVDFTGLGNKIEVVSGKRATDMALRLQYDELQVARIEPDLAKALETIINSRSGQKRRIYCTYTAMLAIRAKLATKTKLVGGL